MEGAPSNSEIKDGDVKVKRTWFVHSEAKKIEDFYEFKPQKDIIGQGTYSNIVKASMKNEKQTRAIKIIPKSKIKNQEHFRSAVEKICALDHPNIVRLYEIFEDSRHIYLVMELCKGGDLFEHIVEKGSFTEAEAKTIFHQIMQALTYCHSIGICHKDLKPENFLLLTDKPNSPVKVIDFGLSKVFTETSDDANKPKVSMATRVGPPYYISPEAIQGRYDEASDIWSAGVVLYMILCGYPPFSANTDAQILDSIQKGIYDFNGPEWKEVSELVKDLIRKMLCRLDKRLKAEEVLKHPWFKENTDKKSDKPLKLNYQMLKNFKNAQKLKKIVLTCIASQMSEGEISELPRLFRELDVNGDGVLTFEELKAGLSGLNEKSSQEIDELMESIDTDKSGTINYTEFLASTMEQNMYMKEEKLWSVFKMFDTEGNGKISAKELMNILGKDLQYSPNLDYYQQLIKEVDKNGDGEVDYNEFIEMMSSNKETK